MSAALLALSKLVAALALAVAPAGSHTSHTTFTAPDGSTGEASSTSVVVDAPPAEDDVHVFANCNGPDGLTFTWWGPLWAMPGRVCTVAGVIR